MAKTEFLKKVELLCAEHGLTLTSLCRTIGLSVSTPTNWKKGYLPNASTQKLIANYFNISVNDLMGIDNSDTVSILSDNEMGLVAKLRKLNEADRAFVKRMIDLLSREG